MNILIVEDDVILSEGIARTMQRMGHATTVVHDGARARRLLDGPDGFGLVLLDIGLPGIDGIGLLQALRLDRPGLPVVLLTARNALEDRIRGLDLGADDYLVKPVALAELAARVRALVRRSSLEASEVLTHGAIRMETASRRLYVDDAEIEVTGTEWRLLEYLLRRPERVVSKQQLLVAGFGDDDPGYNAVEVYISRLRAKFEASGLRIRTVRGFGYMVEDRRPSP